MPESSTSHVDLRSDFTQKRARRSGSTQPDVIAGNPGFGTVAVVEPAFRVTRQTRVLLEEMLRDPAGEHYGFELAKATGLGPSTLYPTFARLERAGWLEGSWERIDPEVIRRPPRRYYKLTATGLREAKNLVTQGTADGGIPGVLGT